MTTTLVIQIDDSFRLIPDRTGWELQQFREAEKGPRRGQLDWFSEGHFDTLQWALRGAYRLMLHTGYGEARIVDLAERIEVAEARLVTALDRDYLSRQQGSSPVDDRPKSVWERIDRRPVSEMRLKAGGER